MRSLVLLIAVASLLLGPAAARAATARVGDSHGVAAFVYTAGQGERNRLEIDYEDDCCTVRFHDRAAMIGPGERCTAIDVHTVECSLGSPGLGDFRSAEVHLGDRDDELDVASGAAASVFAFGGRGDDLMVSGDGPDRLDGGGGRDRLRSGGGRDFLTDGDRSGARGGAGPGPDVLDGGPDVDRVSYEQRTRPVTVRLADRAGGERGEDDVLRSVQDASGGTRGDRLVGDGLRNDLRGRGGDDVLIGRGGTFDVLVGGRGRDRMAGGAGRDALRGNRGLDSHSCGSGEDSVQDPVAGELLERDCELIYIVGFFGGDAPGSWTFPAYPRGTRATVFRIPCPQPSREEPEPGEWSPCRATIELRRGTPRGRLLGRGRIDQPAADSSDRITVKLTKLGRRLARRPHGVVTTVVITGERPPDTAWTIRLKR